MENTIFIMLFIGGFSVLLGTMGVEVVKLILNFVIRCLSVLIIIYNENL